MSTQETEISQAPAARRLPAMARQLTGVAALFVLIAVFGLMRPAFFSLDNSAHIFNAAAIIGILAVGQSFPLISGGFDLSQGAIASLSGAVTASLLSRYNLPIPVAVAGGLSAGLLLGAVNGLLISRVRINPFVATLGTQTAFLGLTNVYTNNQPLSLGSQRQEFRVLSYGDFLGLSWAALLFLALIVVLFFVLRFTPYGQHLYALGGSEEATRLAGLPVDRLKFRAYLLSGLFAAMGGMVMIARAGQASPVAGVGYELDSLASCIVGGIALGGGVGDAWNVLLGTLILGVIDNGLQMVGDVVSPNWRLVIRGAIILLAVAVDARARRRQ